jgi:hypothetical protein
VSPAVALCLALLLMVPSLFASPRRVGILRVFCLGCVEP